MNLPEITQTTLVQADQDRIAKVPASTRPTHTPGPWMASQAFFFGHDSWQITGTIGDTSPFLCHLTDDTPDYAANARLIAAAPELLAALEKAAELAEGAVKILRQFDVESGRVAAECVLRDARAAIAKATGGAA